MPSSAKAPDSLLANEAAIASLHALKCYFCKKCGSPMELALPADEHELRHVCKNSACGFIDYHNPKMVVGCVIEHEGKVLLCKRALEPCSGLWTLPAGYMELGETSAGAPTPCPNLSCTFRNTRHLCACLAPCAIHETRRGQRALTSSQHDLAHSMASAYWTWPACVTPSCHSLVLNHARGRAEGAARETWEEANAAIDIAAPYAHLDIPIIGQAYIFFRGTLAPAPDGTYSFSAGPESEEVQLFAPEDIPFDSLAFSSVLLTLQRWVADKKKGSYTMAHGVIRKKPGASYRDPDAFQYSESYEVDLAQDVIERRWMLQQHAPSFQSALADIPAIDNTATDLSSSHHQVVIPGHISPA